jgi:uncharacterized protein YhbP (UPF0306 family)
MITMADPADVARRLIDTNLYVTLATADADGRPWASPVYYAPVDYRELLWVSDPQQRHSRNLGVRPQLGLVIFDSTVEVGTAQAVYFDAHAEQVADEELERCIEIFSRRSLSTGGRAWTLEDVRSPARLRLYRARASEMSVLDNLGDQQEGDRRIPIALDDLA